MVAGEMSSYARQATVLKSFHDLRSLAYVATPSREGVATACAQDVYLLDPRAAARVHYTRILYTAVQRFSSELL